MFFWVLALICSFLVSCYLTYSEIQISLIFRLNSCTIRLSYSKEISLYLWFHIIYFISKFNVLRTAEVICRTLLFERQLEILEVVYFLSFFWISLRAVYNIVWSGNWFGEVDVRNNESRFWNERTLIFLPKLQLNMK